MAQEAEALIILSDRNRKGTANLLAEVEKAGLWISVPSYEEELTSRTDSHSPASRASTGRGRHGLRTKLWIPPSEYAFQIAIQYFSPSL